MKHLLNDLSDEEKNRIREQHTGGMLVNNGNFQKLLTTKLGSVNPLIQEQGNPEDFLETSYVQPAIQQGFKEVKEINLPDGEYSKGGSGYRIDINSKDGKYTGYSLVLRNGIRGEWEGEISISGKQPYNTKYYKILFKESGFNAQSEKKQTITTKVATEGVKNVTPEMINSPQFKGTYSGYVFGGVFKGINYEWDCNGVEGMSGVRGLIDGEIITETVDNMFKTFKIQMTDGKPGSPSVGFYSRSGGSFIIYTTTNGKPKCQKF